MTYAGSSCEDIYNNNPETGEHSGYYWINDLQFTYYDMNMLLLLLHLVSSQLVLVLKEDGEELLILKLVQEMIVQADGERQTIPLFFLYRMDTGDNDVQVCLSVSFSTNGISYQNVCGMARDYQ